MVHVSDGLKQDVNSDAGTSAEKKKLSLRVHEVAQDCQNQNGLRHGDYQQYRRYCTRRLKRVRSSEDVRFMFGKGKGFTRKELTADMVTTSTHLEIPLMMAERAWSYSVQRKQETAGAPYRVSRHASKRLAKAAKWASDLEALCLETADERTGLEATAYSSWISGNLLLERRAWQKALERFSIAHRICQEFGKAGRIEDQDLFARRVEELEPKMRFCRYNLNSSRGSADDAAESEKLLRKADDRVDDALAAKLESVLAEARKTQASAVNSVEWRGKQISVRSGDLGALLVKADKLAGRLFQSREAPEGATKKDSKRGQGEPTSGQYLKVVGAYDEALTMISREASKLQGKGGGMKMEAQRAELEALRSYAQHHKLRLMLRRNERVARDLQKRRSRGTTTRRKTNTGKGDRLPDAADIVHVYDALLQSVRSMVANLGGGEHTDDVTEEDDKLVESAKADEARFRAFRCYFMIEALSASHKWAEASTLIDHTRMLCQEAAEMVDDDDPRAESLVELDKMVQGTWHRAAAHALLLKSKREATLAEGVERISLEGGSYGKGRERRPKAERSLQDTLLEFDAGGSGVGTGSKKEFRIADFPPSLALVPCKPRLLDLAFDELEFPDLDERAGVQRARETVEGDGSGGASSISSWIGWALGRK